MLYTEPKIFRKNGIKHFAKFIGEIMETPFSAHVNQECRQLMPTFGAASALLQPVAFGGLEEKLLTQGGITKTHRMTAMAYGSLMFNMPLILEEGFAGLGPRDTTYSCKPIMQALKRAELDNVQSVAYVEPGGGSRKTNRMFGVGRFGFITVQYDDGSDYAKALVFPYMTAPQEVFKQPGAKQLLKDSARIGFWQNHDWFHNITAGCINSRITGTTFDAPIHKAAQNRVSNAYQTNGFRNQGPISFGYFDSNLERWAMRFQREVTAVLMRPTDNPVYKDILRYLKTMEQTGFAASKIKMSDPNLTSAEYAARILAGSLVRAAPQHHRDTQRTLRRCLSICDKSDHPEAKDGVKTAFDKIYSGGWAKSIIFGGGGIYERPEHYAAHFKDMSASAIRLAYTESMISLQEFFDRKAEAPDTQVPDLTAAFAAAAAACNDNYGQGAPAPRLG